MKKTTGNHIRTLPPMSGRLGSEPLECEETANTTNKPVFCEHLCSTVTLGFFLQAAFEVMSTVQVS